MSANRGRTYFPLRKSKLSTLRIDPSIIQLAPATILYTIRVAKRKSEFVINYSFDDVYNIYNKNCSKNLKNRNTITSTEII